MPKKGYKQTLKHRRSISLSSPKYWLGKHHSEETKLKCKLIQRDGKANAIKGWIRILKEIPELEKQGFRCIPITKVIPDIIAIKDGKVYAIEIEYGSKPDYAKYDKNNYRDYFEDIIWILRKKKN